MQSLRPNDSATRTLPQTAGFCYPSASRQRLRGRKIPQGSLTSIAAGVSLFMQSLRTPNDSATRTLPQTAGFCYPSASRQRLRGRKIPQDNVPCRTYPTRQRQWYRPAVYPFSPLQAGGSGVPRHQQPPVWTGSGFAELARVSSLKTGQNATSRYSDQSFSLLSLCLA